MSNTIKYGRALFYPHVNFDDEKWVKTAALYYEGLNRIVPEGYPSIQDSELIKELNEKEEFIRNINPRYEAENIGYDFLRFAETKLFDTDHRQNLIKSLGAIVPESSGFAIHMYKMGYILQQRLPELGLAVRNQNREGWYEFEPVTGAMYMTFLANYLASLDQIPVVTDDPAFQPLIRGIQVDRYQGVNDVGEILASMVIQSVIPENIEDIPAKKIIMFREKYGDERYLFYEEINKLVKDLEMVDRQSTLKDVLESKKKGIDIAVKNLEMSFKGMGISTTTALLGLSIPSFASGLGAAIATAGLISVAAGKLASQGIDYYKSKKGSPYSYVLTLKHKLKSETFAEQLLRGKIIF
ncbi:MAG TPA: DUF6236 family protein [Mucilaginibacter sp.]|jgi:hypothetical protein